MGCPVSKPSPRVTKSETGARRGARRMDADRQPIRGGTPDDVEATDEESFAMYDAFCDADGADAQASRPAAFKPVIHPSTGPPRMKDMREIGHRDGTLMIEPFAYDPSRHDAQPKSSNSGAAYADRWDDAHLRMPCSPRFMSGDGKPMWPLICDRLKRLKTKCDAHSANFKDLKDTIDVCTGTDHDLNLLHSLLNDSYSDRDYERFMFITLPGICSLVLNLDSTFAQPLPLLRQGVSGLVTMSQQQAATLLACSFFCLFPSPVRRNDYQNPNFDTLYRKGPREKIEKLKCILHYFERVVEKMPNGVITFQRFALPKDRYPHWRDQRTPLVKVILTTDRRIEDIPDTLQVDFANKYIGGGVLGNGCVQEEIRFTICPEMLVSLLVCEVMKDDECIFLIGCERYSSYKGYANTFKFAGDYVDNTPKDHWGRRWCHLVAMDAIYFSNPSTQYQMDNVNRELLKAYASFYPQGQGPDYQFYIATGNWGCGAFNGDRQLKAIIQLMAASANGRPLIYAAFGDKKLVQSFSDIYTQLIKQNVTVAELYTFLERYSSRPRQQPLFEYILTKLPGSF